MFNISKKTKIVATIGPATDTYEKMLKLVANGANVFRLNFSHGNHEDHKKRISLTRKIAKDTGVYIPILLDTKGPEIRTGLMTDNAILIKNNHEFRISMKDVLGTTKKISVTHNKLFEDVSIGDHIKIDDGNLDLIIIDKDKKNRELIVKATNEHLLKSRKGVNVPSAKLSMKFISKKDEEDLKFGCENEVDYIAASFTRRANDVLEIKKVLKKYGKPDIPIIAKIENPEGLENIESIVKVADGIMIARGDLGVEVPPEMVPIHQNKIIELCRRYGKPVITATQMLDSMQHHPRPTRAEVSDVAAAISISTDAVMLSAESASGLYPFEAVDMQRKIASAIEPQLDYKKMATDAYDTSEQNNNDAIANSIANTALLIGAKIIVVYTQTGKTAYRISKARPCCPIISISNNKNTVLRSALYWGIYSHLINTPMPDFIEEMEALALKIAHDMHIKPGEPIVMAGGTPTGAGKTNFMRIIYVNGIKGLD